jgi:hypothetical protein
MKKNLTIAGIGIAVLVSAFFAWQYYMQTPNIPSQPHVIQDTRSEIFGSYLGSDYKGNYVWGGAMNLAWTELAENIIKEDIKLNTKDKVALEMVSNLNDAPFSKNDLDEESYYIKSGYGQKTVEEINRESKKKFPSKSFGDLEMDLSPTDIISYAYFLKEVKYETQFGKDDVLFNGQKVKGFIADNKAQRENVKIIKYENDDKFIIKLQLKDRSDELILAKGYDMKNPQTVVEEIKKNNKKYLPTIGESDRFKAPKLHLDHRRDYLELIGKYLANKGFESYFIAQMFENIKFNMDEKGARVEDEAVIAMKESAVMKPEKPKNFILDKPYWVVMKIVDSENPFFILGVNNTELMERK